MYVTAEVIFVLLMISIPAFAMWGTSNEELCA